MWPINYNFIGLWKSLLRCKELTGITDRDVKAEKFSNAGNGASKVNSTKDNHARGWGK